jgi:outer membrane protein TolC
LKQREELILREVSDALHNAKSAFDRVVANRRAREFAQSALEAEEQKLLAGRSSLFFVLQLQSDLAAAESAEVRARADYNKALSQLQFAEGSLVDRTSYTIVIE